MTNPEHDENGQDALSPYEFESQLQDFLNGQSESPFRVSFSRLETVLEGGLPAGAYQSTAWWVNNKEAQSYSGAWLDAGWEVATHRLNEEWVKFREIQRVSGKTDDETNSYQCAICGGRDEVVANGGYPNLVCRACDERAVVYLGDSLDSHEEISDAATETRPNPIFIDGQKCWRRYRHGGWVTMRDAADCKTLEEFYCRHFDSDGTPIHTFR